MGNNFNKLFKLTFFKGTPLLMPGIEQRIKKERVGLEFILDGQLVAAFTNVEKKHQVSSQATRCSRSYSISKEHYGCVPVPG